MIDAKYIYINNNTIVYNYHIIVCHIFMNDY